MSHVTKPDGELYWAAVELEPAAEVTATDVASAVAAVPAVASD